MDLQRKALFISFDAVALSGITVEATKIAVRLREQGIISFLDIGYDIKIDKGNFGRPYSESEINSLQHHFTLVRHDEIRQVEGYNPAFLQYIHDVLINHSQTLDAAAEKILVQQTEKMAQAVANALCAKIKGGVKTLSEFFSTAPAMEDIPHSVLFRQSASPHPRREHKAFRRYPHNRVRYIPHRQSA